MENIFSISFLFSPESRSDLSNLTRLYGVTIVAGNKIDHTISVNKIKQKDKNGLIVSRKLPHHDVTNALVSYRPMYVYISCIQHIVISLSKTSRDRRRRRRRRRTHDPDVRHFRRNELQSEQEERTNERANERAVSRSFMQIALATRSFVDPVRVGKKCSSTLLSIHTYIASFLFI